MSSKNWFQGLERVAWIDVETDSLYRAHRPLPVLLEVAMVITDGDLVELGRYESVVKYSGAFLRNLKPCEWVFSTHLKSGLWDALLLGKSVTSGSDIEQSMLDLVEEHSLGEPMIWGGSSPGCIDRPILSNYMPRLYNALGHRSLDVSCLRLAMQHWGGVEIPDSVLREECTHRAMADTEDAIELARYFRKIVRLMGAGLVGSSVSTAK